MKLTAAIAVAIVIALIAGWAVQKDNGEQSEQPVDRSLEISTTALDGITFGEDQKTAEQPNIKNNESTEPEKEKNMTATLHTEKGDIVIALNSDQTPKTVENFVTLAKKDFYSNTVFHRTIKGFMIQGGDPKGDGTGGPGYKFDDEPFTGEYSRGTVAMANAGPNTNGSQFFIMHADYPLPKNYVIFGNVIKGMDVVDQIATAPTTFSPSGENSKPTTPVKVTSVEIDETE